MKLKQTFNPFTENFDNVINSTYVEFTKTVQTVDGSGNGIFSITVPEGASCFVEVVLMGKREGFDEYYIELITYRLINPGTGNVQSLAGGTASLSENFGTNPQRVLTLGATTASLLVSSGGIQTVNWNCTVRYKLVEWTS